MAAVADIFSLRAASCWKVEVMKGGEGRRRYGLESRSATVKAAPSSRSASPVAMASSTKTTSERDRRPSGPKSRPPAVLTPSTDDREASNRPSAPGPVPGAANVPVRLQ